MEEKREHSGRANLVSGCLPHAGRTHDIRFPWGGVRVWGEAVTYLTAVRSSRTAVRHGAIATQSIAVATIDHALVEAS